MGNLAGRRVHAGQYAKTVPSGEEPNEGSALVSEDKITGYLLWPTHRDGRHKAAFFLGFGFDADAWQTLAAALLKHAANHEVAKVENTPLESGTSWRV